MALYAARPETTMNALRRWWPDVLIVVGVTWLAFACSAYAGDGSVEGEFDQGGGDVAGDISIGYTERERVMLALASSLTTIGVLGKVNQRRPERPQPPSAPPA
jgi:hypothetical protein